MSQTLDVTVSSWLYAQSARLVLVRKGPSTGRAAAIITIVDQSRFLVEGPSEDAERAVPRQVVHANDITLLPIQIENMPRDAGSGAVRKLWQAQNIDEKITNSTFYKKRQQQSRRSTLTDFERFKVMRLKKQARFE